MQFYQTDTNDTKKNINEYRYYEQYCPDKISHDYMVKFNCGMIDDEMMAKGRPYYQIYPEVFEVMSNSALDLDIDDWKVPFDVFEIRMPKTNCPLIPIQPMSSYGVKSIQVFRNYYKRLALKTNSGAHTTYKYIKKECPTELNEIERIYKNNTMIKVNFGDYSNDSNGCKKIVALVTLKYKHQNTIREIVNEALSINHCYFNLTNKNIDHKGMIASLFPCIRLSLEVSLLATASHKILEYDVLSDQLDAYRKMREKGDLAGAKIIENKSRQKGKYGWNIGKPHARRLPLSVNDNGHSSNGHNSGHQYCSYRCRHWHKYHVGPNRSKTVLKLLDVTVVRPDLPERIVA